MINVQRTLKKSVTLTGVGVHSGVETSITMLPAKAGSGIRFKRTDLALSPYIPALHSNVTNTQLATTLGVGNVKISTVEHLLAALKGARVDNAVIEVSGSELPILDGSSIGFYRAILEAGIQPQIKPKPILAIRRRIQTMMGEKWAVIEPSSRFEVHATIEWDHPAIGFQEFHYIEGKTDFNELASARTFGFLKDFESLKKAGLARGGSLCNAIVLNENQVLNPEGLRGADEFVRHKVLDALGDFALAGLPICGYFRLHRAGHDLHHQILSEIFSNPANFEMIDLPTSKPKPTIRPTIAQPGYAATY